MAVCCSVLQCDGVCSVLQCVAVSRDIFEDTNDKAADYGGVCVCARVSTCVCLCMCVCACLCVCLCA